jgi:hypothetical protein
MRPELLIACLLFLPGVRLAAHPLEPAQPDRDDGASNPDDVLGTVGFSIS